MTASQVSTSTRPCSQSQRVSGGGPVSLFLKAFEFPEQNPFFLLGHLALHILTDVWVSHSHWLWHLNKFYEEVVKITKLQRILKAIQHLLYLNSDETYKERHCGYDQNRGQVTGLYEGKAGSTWVLCRLAPRRKLIMCRRAECFRRRSPALIPCCHKKQNDKLCSYPDRKLFQKYSQERSFK